MQNTQRYSILVPRSHSYWLTNIHPLTWATGEMWRSKVASKIFTAAYHTYIFFFFCCNYLSLLDPNGTTSETSCRVGHTVQRRFTAGLTGTVTPGKIQQMGTGGDEAAKEHGRLGRQPHSVLLNLNHIWRKAEIKNRTHPLTVKW